MRMLIGKSNSFNLDVNNLSSYKTSDKLFTGIFQTKSLIHSLILKIRITGGEGASIDYKSLGNLSLLDSQGEKFTIDLRYYYLFVKYLLGVKLNELGISTNNYTIYLPIFFSLFEGIRPKDTYLISEKCNDFYLSINGRPPTAGTITSYSITPFIFGERTFHAYLPSEGFFYQSVDTIPSGIYTSKLNIVGATSFILVKSDLSNFPDDLKIKIAVDGEIKIDVDDYKVLNSFFSYNEKNQFLPTDNVIIFKSTFDKKMAKISRNSNFIITFDNPSSPFDVVCLYRRLRPLTSLETEAILRRMNIPISEKILPIPVDAMGRINPKTKDIARKVINFETEERQKINT